MQKTGDAMAGKQRFDTEEVVDMELQCVRCGTRLYVPLSEASAVIASLARTRAAILICVCGQAQLIRVKRQQHD